MTNQSDPHRPRRWYHYALQRLPLSLLMTLVVVLVGIPLMFYVMLALLRLISD